MFDKIFEWDWNLIFSALSLLISFVAIYKTSTRFRFVFEYTFKKCFNIYPSHRKADPFFNPVRFLPVHGFGEFYLGNLYLSNIGSQSISLKNIFVKDSSNKILDYLDLAQLEITNAPDDIRSIYESNPNNMFVTETAVPNGLERLYIRLPNLESMILPPNSTVLVSLCFQTNLTEIDNRKIKVTIETTMKANKLLKLINRVRGIDSPFVCYKQTIKI